MNLISNKLESLFILNIILLPAHSICQTKLFYDTSNVINGNGIALLQNNSGINFGFATYKNYKLNGAYYLIDTTKDYALKGQLRYKPTCMNYRPGVKVKYVNNADTLTMTMDSTLFSEVFKSSTAKILKTEAALVPETIPGTHPDLNVGLGDPAVVPVGRWQRLDLKRKYVFAQFDFDDCGNILLTTYFKRDGSILNKYKYKAKLK